MEMLCIQLDIYTRKSLEKLRELSWSGIPPFMRPNVWGLLLGYAPPNSDRRKAVLTRKRLEYVDCVSQYYDIPDIERSDEEINMLRQFQNISLVHTQVCCILTGSLHLIWIIDKDCASTGPGCSALSSTSGAGSSSPAAG